MIKVAASLLFVMLLGTACSTPRTSASFRFNEQDQADLIVRYYTDDTSYVVKPVAKDGLFFSVLRKNAVIDLARQQASRDLAVVILIHYPNQDQDSAIREDWARRLAEAGYQRVVFLRSAGGTKVKNLPVLAQGG
jgi:hypothetical protein